MSKRGTEKSFAKVAKQIAAFAKREVEGFGVGLRVAGEEILTDVNTSRPGRGVPRDTGTLASTGRVTLKTRDSGGRFLAGGARKVVISYGGAAARYALIQHERLDFHHVLGEARYLVRGLERYQFSGSQALAALREQHTLAARRARALA